MEIPLKVYLLRNKLTTTTTPPSPEAKSVRRIRLLDPTYQTVHNIVSEWATTDFTLHYTDDECDLVTLGSEIEWKECVRVWLTSQNDKEDSAASAFLPTLKLQALMQRVDASQSSSSSTPTKKKEKKMKKAKKEKKDKKSKKDHNEAKNKYVMEMMTRTHGYDIFYRLRDNECTVDELGYSSWLSVDFKNNEATLTIKEKQLERYLSNTALSLMDSNPEKASELFLDITGLFPDRKSIYYYNAACCAAIMKQKKEAIELLKDAVKNGWTDGIKMIEDGDLESLRGEDGFLEIVRSLVGFERQNIIDQHQQQQQQQQQQQKEIIIDNTTDECENIPPPVPSIAFATPTDINLQSQSTSVMPQQEATNELVQTSQQTVALPEEFSDALPPVEADGTCVEDFNLDELAEQSEIVTTAPPTTETVTQQGENQQENTALTAVEESISNEQVVDVVENEENVEETFQFASELSKLSDMGFDTSGDYAPRFMDSLTKHNGDLRRVLEEML